MTELATATANVAVSERPGGSQLSMRGAVAIFLCYLALSSYNQILLLPFERAFTPGLRTLPPMIAVLPVMLVVIFHIAVWLSVSGAMAGWVWTRSPDDPLSNFRATFALVGWCHMPLLVWAVISLPLIVWMLSTFVGLPINRYTVAANADAMDALRWVGRLRPGAWLAAWAMLIVVIARQRHSWWAGIKLAVPPLVALLVLLFVVTLLLPQ